MAAAFLVMMMCDSVASGDNNDSEGKHSEEYRIMWG